MKRIIMFALLFAALKVAGQTTGYLRYDTVKIMKQGGTCELYIINKTKDSLGLLTNVGGGLTQFKRARAINDSTIIIGNDTILIKGAGGNQNLQQVLNNGSILTENESITIADSIKFILGDVVIDSLRLPSLPASTDTTAHKPIAVDASGNVVKMGGWPGGGGVNNRYSIDKGTADSLQLLNDVSISALKRNHSYGPLNDSVRKWHPSYWSFIDKYYADTAKADQANVGGSSSVKLSNGTWLTAYVGSGSNPEDGNSSTIYAINSADNLRTFYNKRQIVSLDTLDAHFGPSLYVKGTNISTGDTVILVWATQINGVDFNYVGDIRMRQSNDGGATWGAISIIRASAGEYYNNFPNRIFKTNSGKLIYPLELLRPGSQGPGITSSGWDGRFLYSTNNGTTWTYSTALPAAADSGMVESGLYQRKGETRLYWYSRSLRRTAVYTAYSDDDGVTWTTPNYMNYTASFSNTTIKYVNSIDAFIGFSNRANGTTQAEKRKYLNAFISNDGQNFKQFMSVDSVVDTAPGVIGVSDIIDLDSSIVIFYSELPNTANAWGNMKVARIPRPAISSSFENIGTGLGVPSGGDADRISPSIPNIRWNTTGYYEGSAGTMFGYASLLATGNSFDPVYPFKTMKLQSNSQIGRLTLYNKDAVMGYYGEYQCEKSYNNNYNMGAGQIVGKYGFNTVAEWRGITNADAPGGFSNVDMTFWAINSAGSNGERFRITADGNVGINTDVPAFALDVNGKAAIRTADSAASPANMLWIDPNTKEIKKAAVGGLASINSQTGPAITVSGQGAIVISNPSANNIGIAVDVTSDLLPRTIDAIITTAQNTGTSETDLYTKTIAGGTLNTDKQTLNFEADGEFNDNTATAQLKLYFGGNVTLNTGAVNISTANTAWRLTGYIIRTSSTTAHVTYELESPGLATQKFLGYSNLTSLDFTTSNIFKITAQAGGAGGGTADITAHSWQVLYKPAP